MDSQKRLFISPFEVYLSTAVTGAIHRVTKGSPGATRRRGAAIHDTNAGMVYSVIPAADGSARLDYIQITPARGEVLNWSDLMPQVTMALLANDHLKKSTAEFTFAINVRAPERKGKSSRPTLGEIARQYKAILADADADSPRVELATIHHKSKLTIDDWIRECRDAGLIPPASGGKRGPKTKPTTPEPKETR